MAKETEQRDPVEVLGEEFLERRRRGEPATIQEYATAHPELAEGIRGLFPAMLAMEQFKSCKLSSSGGRVDMQVERVEQLGDYRIIREIGRGGMGVVYEAEQQSLGRRVAVKVFPRQMLRDSRQLKRFHREARTAASLHHTNIVPVFGVGEHEGLHYYVMQRIDGLPLDGLIHGVERPTSASGLAGDETKKKHRDSSATGSLPAQALETTFERLQRRLVPMADDEQAPPKSIRDLTPSRTRQQYLHWRGIAQIGVQVAEALAYAHAHGVLHRDIKPSNLLLDPQGTVWVTDFGLATVLEAERLSNPGDVVGTLRFMAPEHVHGEHDARSDIYSLGLTLYELLTCQPAFADKNRADVIEKILKGELTYPRRIRPEIPRDLEAIVLKTLAREPKRRYDSAASLATDLRRFIEGRPVQARRIGAIGRGWRWAQRNPAIAALTTALVVVVLASFVLIGSQWREAVAENRRAEDNLALALESMDQILERFASRWMAHPIATESADGEASASSIDFQVAVSDHNAAVLQDALRFYDRFARQNPTNPQLQRDTAKVHRRVGDIYERLGQYAEAEQAYERSLKLLETQGIADRGASVIELASTLNQLGLTMYATSRFGEAEVEFRRAQQLLSVTPLRDAPGCQAELARAYNNLGQVLWLQHRRESARQAHRQAIALLERLVEEYPGEADYRVALARAYRIYYPFVVYGQRGDHDRIRSAGITLLEQLVSDFPNVPDYQCELSEMLTTTSLRPPGFRSTDRQAEQLHRAAELARELSDSHPSIPRYRAVLARTLKELGKTVSGTRPAEADMHYAASVTLYRDLSRQFGDIPAYHTLLAMALRDQAETLRGLGRHSDARVALDEGILEQQIYVELRSESGSGRRTLGRMYEELAEVLVILGETDEAQQAQRESEQLRAHSSGGWRRGS